MSLRSRLLRCCYQTTSTAHTRDARFVDNSLRVEEDIGPRKAFEQNCYLRSL